MWARLRRYFISGLVVFLPLALTVYVFVALVSIADGILGKYLEPVFYHRFGFYFRGVSIIVGVLGILVIGFFVTNFIGRKIYDFFERLLIKLPFFRQVYPAFKEIVIFLFSRDKMSFRQVVLVEYPRKGIYSLGFLTNESGKRFEDAVGKDLVNVFVPSAPGPLTGYVILVPKDEVVFTDISVEETIKFIVSGGVVNPKF